ncbi:glutamate synthase ferredoxin dependend large subunit [Clostridium aceticum]|uniref:Glutamate synthase ferredoxin dependend large subunit n=1 Tax=Clostridium aceticum TaxID=84022 RepID=A0A0D8IBW1_9CLOT|nr:glutamate synthase large subunit [Clostridium aceticum]AKL94844.1 glutamate synthase ferredoxin dependend large subunit [Clostridium aceticum]KJF27778.1 glutamate synthase [Clostridium aceticum]
MTNNIGYPSKQGLYDPQFEKDSCGVGFVASIKGEKTHDIVKKGLKVLVNLTHRGAVGSDPKTGDGAGILTQIPDEFFRIYCDNLGISLPSSTEYGIGMIFLPKEPALRLRCEGIVERVVEEEGQKVLGWRDVPTDNRSIGETAKGTEPTIRQVFVEKASAIDQEAFERRLYIIRKKAENEVKRLIERNSEYFYICSMSSKTIVYKGLLLADQINQYYVDLNDINFKSAIALVHQRYSTNTFPTWDLAHPFRYIAHNGEINTIRGNRNWMNAREGVLKSEVFGKEINKLFPIIGANASDSASFDNVLELLVADGRSLAHSLMMLIPQTWRDNDVMAPYKRAFYEYHASFMEPWDGPAAVACTDGEQVCTVLDRNGLRPARYVITKNGLVVLASEAGALELDAKEIESKGKLKPGKIFLVDTKEGRIIPDHELKKKICTEKPYEEMIESCRMTLDQLESNVEKSEVEVESLVEKQQAFGYTLEDLKLILGTMASIGKEPIGSMGNDTPLAVLSNRPQLLFTYFKQLFAQVTNPPIDCIREEMVMSLTNFIGTQENILNKNLPNQAFIKIKTPILTNLEMAKIKGLRNKDFKTTTIPITFKYDTGIEGFKAALQQVCERASKRIEEGYNIVVLSDRNVGSYDAAIPSLLAVSALQHHLIQEKTRTKISIIVETAEARETMHMALLIGYGATAINPYLAFESIDSMIKKGDIKDIDFGKAEKNYVKALSEGLLKILSRMGISTLQSYHGAQIFEAIGLSSEFINDYFEGTPSRVEGVGIETIGEEVLIRHRNAFNKIRKPIAELDAGGIYSWRKDGEYHLFNPETIYKLQVATRSNDYGIYKEYAEVINDQNQHLCTIRGLLKFKENNPIPINEVEPISEIVKRFCTGAMSFGSISKEAHETIAIAMNRLGARSNSGEGGEDAERYKIEENGDLRRSAIKQVASARFGVTAEYLVNADEIQIKMAQGAKPGEGGQLPGSKVDKAIARTRNSTPGIDLISPPPHHDIYSIEDLSQLIFDLKSVNASAKISVKLVSEVGVGTVAAGVAKAHADVILISGHDGGTGASPVSSIKHVGTPWELGVAEAQQVLLLNNLRSRVRLQTDGQLKTGRDVAIAALLGAEEFGFATTALVVLGCTMLRNCHENTCEMGIATQDPEIRRNFRGKPEYIINFFTFIAQEVREIMAQLGFRTMNEMIGRVDLLEPNKNLRHWKANKVDLSSILYKPDMPKRIKPYCVKSQDHGLDKLMDYKLLQVAQYAIDSKAKVRASFEIKNVDRSVGAMLSGKIAKKYGEEGLPEDTIVFELTGSAGQSFGAFCANGLTLILEGEANDYVGKGLSGGKLVIKTPRTASYKQDENVIAGNTILYGATSGKVFINGIVGQRFAVRNSGALAVVEGVGDHCCEYMTGGMVVVLGKTGRNFAAGMSGGVAYVLDVDGDFEGKCNKSMVTVEDVKEIEELAVIHSMIQEHYQLTNSEKAGHILADWDGYSSKLKKIISPAYKSVLEKMKQQRVGKLLDTALMEVCSSKEA